MRREVVAGGVFWSVGGCREEEGWARAGTGDK